MRRAQRPSQVVPQRRTGCRRVRETLLARTRGSCC